jgi:phosphoglycerate dehydrogenase-like enzyme
MIKVYLKHPLTPEHLSALHEQLSAEVHLVTAENQPEPAGHEILVHGTPTRDDLTVSPGLRALVVPWAGTPFETLELMREFPDIAVHSLHYNPGPTAEMAMALLLTAAKRVIPFDRLFRQHHWSPIYPGARNGVLLEGKTALILGHGRVGQRVAEACRALGMQVIGVRRTADATSQANVFPPGALPKLLPRANVLIICVPHTGETTGLIGAAELGLLPQDAILVNVARGLIVDEEALYQALKERRLFGAGLDVWYQYPTQKEREADAPVPPSRFPFHELDNVVMMPHRAGWSEETEWLRIRHLADLLNAAARGEAMPGRVDPRLGY